MFSGDSSGTVIVWNTYNNVEAKSKKRRTQSTGQDHVTTSTVPGFKTRYFHSHYF